MNISNDKATNKRIIASSDFRIIVTQIWYDIALSNRSSLADNYNRYTLALVSWNPLRFVYSRLFDDNNDNKNLHAEKCDEFPARIGSLLAIIIENLSNRVQFSLNFPSVYLRKIRTKHYCCRSSFQVLLIALGNVLNVAICCEYLW